MSFTLRSIAALASLTTMLLVSEGAAQKRDPYLLTHDEIATHKDIRTAYEAVQQLRPRFFRGSKSFSPERGVTSSTSKPEEGQDPAGGTSPTDGILVVLDGSRRGGVAELKTIVVDQVDTIRFIKSDEARATYGPDQAGVIEVKSVAPTKNPGTP